MSYRRDGDRGYSPVDPLDGHARISSLEGCRSIARHAFFSDRFCHLLVRIFATLSVYFWRNYCIPELR